MHNMPNEGKTRCQAYLFYRQILEMAHKFLSWLEGIFQQSSRFRERGNQEEVQFHKVLI